MKYAVALAESFKAKLVVLHVCEHPIAGSGIEAYHFAVPEYVVDLEQRERKALDALTTELRERQLDVEPVFIVGKAYQEIVKTAGQHEVDVITMATHGSKGISHLVFGSTAEKVVRLAPCPVSDREASRARFCEVASQILELTTVDIRRASRST